MIIKSCRLVRDGWETTILKLSPVLFAKYRYFKLRKRRPNLRNPESFDEKLLWLMLYWRNPLKGQCGDKYEMRGYVNDQGLGHLLPELLGVYRHSREIDFALLPDRFVLKCTHGSGFNIICGNKAHLDIAEARRTLDKWMRRDFSKAFGEIHYAQMMPRIICERFLDDLESALPRDYKVYCFHGKARYIMVCTGRSVDGGHAAYHFYDREWRERLPFDKTTAFLNCDIQKPEGLEVMIDAAERLSQPFPFVRIDFYCIRGRVVLGEMTLTPAGCIDTDLVDFGQRLFGSLINLPPKRLKWE